MLPHLARTDCAVAVWSLVPLDPNDPGREASSHRGLVIVRAASERQAWTVAAEAI
jgi:hypothetical protein